jgi:3-(3-hydroxy-phenyl)propionate hydroxylase
VSSDYEVIVVGFGPTGVSAANFLGAYGLKTLVLERTPDVYGRARAVTVDDFTLRLMQQVGLDEVVKREMDPKVAFSFRTLRNNREFFRRHQTFSEYGQPPICMIYQPAMERALREGVDRYRENVEVKLECEVVEVTNGCDSAQVTFRNATGSLETATAQYVLACDGGSSDVRRSIGIPMVGEPGGETWVVIDAKVTKWWPGRESVKSWYQPDFPAIDIPLALGHHRWEFPLPEGETRESLTANEGWWPLMERLGVTRENVTVTGHAYYQHNEMAAESWSCGRIFLLGDAAHMMAPWAGQGMQSGIRDAQNLSWKLNAVLRYKQPDGLLDTYQIEREPHVKAMTKLAHEMGEARTDPSEIRHKARVTKFFIAGRLPVVGRNMREWRGKPPARVSGGFLTGPIGRKSPIGLMIPQPRVARANGLRLPLDDALGPWFAIIGLNTDPRHRMTKKQQVDWEQIGARFVTIYSSEKAEVQHEDDLVDYTNQLADWMTRRSVDVIAVRPDRFIAAADRTGLDLPALAVRPARAPQLDLGRV